MNINKFGVLDLKRLTEDSRYEETEKIKKLTHELDNLKIKHLSLIQDFDLMTLNNKELKSIIYQIQDNDNEKIKNELNLNLKESKEEIKDLLKKNDILVNKINFLTEDILELKEAILMKEKLLKDLNIEHKDKLNENLKNLNLTNLKLNEVENTNLEINKNLKKLELEKDTLFINLQKSKKEFDNLKLLNDENLKNNLNDNSNNKEIIEKNISKFFKDNVLTFNKIKEFSIEATKTEKLSINNSNIIINLNNLEIISKSNNIQINNNNNDFNIVNSNLNEKTQTIPLVPTIVANKIPNIPSIPNKVTNIPNIPKIPLVPNSINTSNNLTSSIPKIPGVPKTTNNIISNNEQSTSISVVPGVPKIPGAPLVPIVPGIPKIPGAPNVPTIPGASSIPTLPGAPLVPKIPGAAKVPTKPGAPSVPKIPDAPSVPKIPGAPSVPGIPKVLNTPSVPDQTQIKVVLPKATVSKPVIKLEKKTKALHWTRVLILPESIEERPQLIWNDIKEVPLDLNEIQDLFEMKVISYYKINSFLFFRHLLVYNQLI